MAAFINAVSGGAGGIQSKGDASGALNIQTAGTTAIAIDASQNVTFAANQTVAGNLTLSGAGNIVLNVLNTYSTAANGYQKLPSGIIIQWGSVAGVNSTPKSFTWPIAFPTAFLSGSLQNTGQQGYTELQNPSTTGAQAYSSNATGQIQYFIAIGY